MDPWKLDRRENLLVTANFFFLENWRRLESYSFFNIRSTTFDHKYYFIILSFAHSWLLLQNSSLAKTNYHHENSIWISRVQYVISSSSFAASPRRSSDITTPARRQSCLYLGRSTTRTASKAYDALELVNSLANMFGKDVGAASLPTKHVLSLLIFGGFQGYFRYLSPSQLSLQLANSPPQVSPKLSRPTIFPRKSISALAHTVGFYSPILLIGDSNRL